MIHNLEKYAKIFIDSINVFFRERERNIYSNYSKGNMKHVPDAWIKKAKKTKVIYEKYDRKNMYGNLGTYLQRM